MSKDELAASRDGDREMWEHIAARMKAKREQEDLDRVANNTSMDWTWLPERCPDCRCNWNISPPARIHNGSGFHTGDCRCVNCKRVYSPPPKAAKTRTPNE